MSGIYIPDMEMPNENDSIHILRDGTAVVYRAESIDFYKAITVPAHGDLIDRDALPTPRVEWEDIVNATAVIPASKGK